MNLFKNIRCVILLFDTRSNPDPWLYRSVPPLPVLYKTRSYASVSGPRRLSYRIPKPVFHSLLPACLLTARAGFHRANPGKYPLKHRDRSFLWKDLILLTHMTKDIFFDKEGAELLFTLFSLCTGKKSTIVTTNLSINLWSKIFGDPVLTAATVT